MRMLRRLGQWLRFGARDEDLAEELEFHREAIERDLIARGHSPADARDAARRAMGNQTIAREASRAVWLSPSLEGVWQDARVTVRGLLRNPIFAAGVILTFALGVGANAAMFSLLDRMMFRPPALMRDPTSVNRVHMYRTSNGVETPTGGQYARNADVARWSTSSFSAMAMHSIRQLAVGVGQDAREMRIAIVSSNFFDFFDAPPAAGRYFVASEDAPPSGSPVSVLSHAAWQAQYGARQDVIGSKVQIGAVVYTIIGVAAKDFVGLWPMRPPAAFIPVSTYAASTLGPKWQTTYSSSFGLSSIARRRAGVSIDAASADLSQALVQSYRAEGGGDQRLATLRPRALAGSVLIERGPNRSGVARVATWLGGVAIIVLLIACANVASLLLARALSKRREIAMRLALGVSRARLLTQLLTESMVLALAGSLLGIAIAMAMSATLSAAFLPGTERLSVAGDGRTLAFIGIVTLVVGIFTGVLPVLQARRLDLTDDLKTGSRATFRRSHARSALLVLQGALSLVLLTGAGLFVRSLRNVRDVHLGFDPDSVLVVTPKWRDVTLDSAQTRELRLRLVDAATTVPGIRAATLQQSEPFGGMSDWPIAVAGIDSARKFGTFEFNAVSPGYFATMGTRILRGRAFDSRDVAGANGAIVVSDAMGKVLWPGKDPLGQCVRIGIHADTMPCRFVVGIAEDIHARGFGPQARNFYYYLPAAQWHQQGGGLFVRATGDVSAAIEPVRRRLQEEMPGSSYVTVERLGDLVDAESRSWVMGATVFTAFGALALVLAAVGLYSVVAYDVARRRQELAVRVALGAGSANVMRLVLGEGVRFAVTGAVIGSAIALFAAPRLAPLLFNQSPRDPVVLGTVAGVLLLVAVIASIVPAVRGARVDPSAVLRAE